MSGTATATATATAPGSASVPPVNPVNPVTLVTPAAAVSVRGTRLVPAVLSVEWFTDMYNEAVRVRDYSSAQKVLMHPDCPQVFLDEFVERYARRDRVALITDSWSLSDVRSLARRAVNTPEVWSWLCELAFVEHPRGDGGVAAALVTNPGLPKALFMRLVYAPAVRSGRDGWATSRTFVSSRLFPKMFCRADLTVDDVAELFAVASAVLDVDETVGMVAGLWMDVSKPNVHDREFLAAVRLLDCAEATSGPFSDVVVQFLFDKVWGLVEHPVNPDGLIYDSVLRAVWDSLESDWQLSTAQVDRVWEFFSPVYHQTVWDTGTVIAFTNDTGGTVWYDWSRGHGADWASGMLLIQRLIDDLLKHPACSGDVLRAAVNTAQLSGYLPSIANHPNCPPDIQVLHSLTVLGRRLGSAGFVV